MRFWVVPKSTKTITKDSEWIKLSTEDKRKFWNSKLVNDNWELKVLYHWTPYKWTIKTFDENLAWSNVNVDFKWVYFTDNLDFAEQFAHQQLEWSSILRTKLWERGNIYKAYVNMEKPLDLNTAKADELLPYIKDDLTKWWSEERKLRNLEWHPQSIKFYIDMNKVEDAWYDWIIARIKNEWEWNEYIVFKGTQAKNIWKL